MKTVYLLILCISLGGMSACSSVQPWEKDILAQKKMQLDPYPNDGYLDEHIYYSKESSSGGAGVGGGGCGCN